MQNVTDTNKIQVEDGCKIIHQICATVLFVGGIIVNPLCMTAIFKAKIQNTISSILLINIILNNLLLTFIPILSALIIFHTHHTKLETDTICKSIGYISNTLAGAELAGLAFISLNFYAVIVPNNLFQEFFSIHRNIALLISSSYIMSGILPSFPLLGILGTYSRGPGGIYCTSYRDGENFGRVAISIILGILFLILIYTYCGILCVVRHSQRTVAAMENSDRSNTTVHGSQRKVDKTYVRKHYDRQLIKSFSSMVLSFLILYLPLTVSVIVDPTGESWSAYGTLIVSYIACSHCVVNSLVYTLTNRKLRNTLVTLLCSYGICIQT